MKERLTRILNHQLTIPFSVGIGSFGVGIGLGYILGHRKSKYKLHSVPEQLELDFTVDDLAELREKPESLVIDEETFMTIRETGGAILEGEDFVKSKLNDFISIKDEPNEIESTESEEAVIQNIFAGDDDDWDFEQELEKRTELEPYVLHKDEFYNEESGYTQITLTYYEGDNILCDEDNTPVYNHSQVIGPMIFGHGSGDPNVFYVRNDKRKAEYEIIRDQGLYSVEVLGLEIENNERTKDLKHSGHKKFRMD